MRVKRADRGRRPGRILVRAHDPTLTPYAGLAVVGGLARRLGLVGLIDAELARERRAQPVKRRRRGLSPGELVLSLAESQLVGGEFFDHVEDLRADGAGACPRAVAATPAAPTALQNAKRFRRCHVQRVERALARAGERLGRALGRDRDEPVAVDLDATQVTACGQRKEGAGEKPPRRALLRPPRRLLGRARAGADLGARGRRPGEALRRRVRAGRPAGARALARGARPGDLPGRLSLLPARAVAGAAPRAGALHRLAAAQPGALADARRDSRAGLEGAIELEGAEVAETTYTPEGWQGEPLRLVVRRVPFSAEKIAAGSVSARRRKTIHPGQLALALEGEVASVFGYSFILTDIDDQSAAWVEHFHRQRARVEERLKENKLGQALRHLPSGNEDANRLWLATALLALNLSAFCCDLCPAAGSSGKAPEDAPLRRAAKTLRRLLFCVPARIVRTGRRLILRLPEGFRHAQLLQATLDAVWALAPP